MTCGGVWVNGSHGVWNFPHFLASLIRWQRRAISMLPGKAANERWKHIRRIKSFINHVSVVCVTFSVWFCASAIEGKSFPLKIWKWKPGKNSPARCFYLRYQLSFVAFTRGFGRSFDGKCQWWIQLFTSSSNSFRTQTLILMEKNWGMNNSTKPLERGWNWFWLYPSFNKERAVSFVSLRRDSGSCKSPSRCVGINLVLQITKIS